MPCALSSTILLDLDTVFAFTADFHFLFIQLGHPHSLSVSKPVGPILLLKLLRSSRSILFNMLGLLILVETLFISYPWDLSYVLWISPFSTFFFFQPFSS